MSYQFRHAHHMPDDRSRLGRSQEQLRAHISANCVDVTATPKDMRMAFERMCPAPVQVDPTVWNGMPGRLFGELHGGQPIIWLHGGGYVFGSSNSHSRAATALSEASGRSVFVADYPLAPEHSYHDIFDFVALWIDILPEPVELVGDSAGGHLALNLARKLPHRVDRLALISPNTDRVIGKPSRQINSAKDLTNSDQADHALFELAFGRDDGKNLCASPALSNLSGLPPVYLTASIDEVLIDDSLLLIQLLTKTDVTLEARILSGLFHMWPLWPDELPEARVTLEEIAAFMTSEKTHSLPLQAMAN